MLTVTILAREANMDCYFTETTGKQALAKSWNVHASEPCSDHLGVVRWFGGSGEYGFDPALNACLTAGRLRCIAEFCDNLRL